MKACIQHSARQVITLSSSLLPAYTKPEVQSDRRDYALSMSFLGPWLDLALLSGFPGIFLSFLGPLWTSHSQLLPLIIFIGLLLNSTGIVTSSSCKVKQLPLIVVDESSQAFWIVRFELGQIQSIPENGTFQRAARPMQ